MESGWQKSKWAQNAKCEYVLEGYASKTVEDAMDCLSSSVNGLTEDEAAARLKTCGPNSLSSKKPPAWWQLLLSVLPNPFNILLTILAVISAVTPPPNWVRSHSPDTWCPLLMAIVNIYHFGRHDCHFLYGAVLARVPR